MTYPPWDARNWPPHTDMTGMPGRHLRKLPHEGYVPASEENPKVPELRWPRLSDDMAFRLMFGSVAFAAAMIVYVVGRFIAGPWRES